MGRGVPSCEETRFSDLGSAQPKEAGPRVAENPRGLNVVLPRIAHPPTSNAYAAAGHSDDWRNSHGRAPIAVGGGAASAQKTSDATQVEIAAGRAMLATPLDHRASRSRSAIRTTWRSPKLRDYTKRVTRVNAAALAAAIGGKLRTYPGVRDCTGDCLLVGVTAHVTLSPPTFNGATAMTTVTLMETSSDGKMDPVDYETVQFTLSRRANGWVVTKRQQLGVS